jgi:hypothetical protein
MFDEGKGFVCDPADTTIAVGLQKGSALLAQVNEALAALDKETREQMMEQAIANQPLSE